MVRTSPTASPFSLVTTFNKIETQKSQSQFARFVKLTDILTLNDKLDCKH
jgi:hypothetical protein